MKKIFIIFTLIFIGSTFTIFAQPKKVNRQDFFAALRTAGNLKFNNSRREKITSTLNPDSASKSTKIEIKEFVLPDKQRLFSVEEENGKKEKSEIIKIGETGYHRKNDGKWVKEENMNFPMSFSGIPVPITEEFSVEDAILNNKPAKLYRWFAVYYQGSEEKIEENKRFFEGKTWIDDRGFEIKYESVLGKLKPKVITFHKLGEYEYNPKDLKIEAPVIGR